MSTPNPSGRLEFEGDTIVYTLPAGEAWRMPVADILVVGEFTTAEGPSIDDYFFLFVARNQYFEASFYADGRDALLAGLGDRLRHTFATGLCHSTSLASRILWPPRLEGRPLFDLVPEERAGGILGRIRQRLSPRVLLNLTDEVKSELGPRPE